MVNTPLNFWNIDRLEWSIIGSTICILTRFVFQMETATGSTEVATESDGHLIGFGLDALRIRGTTVTSSICTVIDAVKHLKKIISALWVHFEIKIYYFELHQTPRRHSNLPVAVGVRLIQLGIIWWHDISSDRSHCTAASCRIKCKIERPEMTKRN